jgi:hypothetical protein
VKEIERKEIIWLNVLQERKYKKSLQCKPGPFLIDNQTKVKLIVIKLPNIQHSVIILSSLEIMFYLLIILFVDLFPMCLTRTGIVFRRALLDLRGLITNFMAPEPEGLSQHERQPATGPNARPGESTPHPPNQSP